MRLKKMSLPANPEAAIVEIVREVSPTGHWDLWRDGVTQSLITNFLWCPMKFKWRHLEGLAPAKTSGSLDFGSIAHELFDRIYGACKHVQGEGLTFKFEPDLLRLHIASLYERDRKKLQEMEISGTQEQELEKTYGMVEALLRVYFDRFQNDFEDYTFLDLERVFDVPYTYPDGAKVRLRGKFDGVLRVGGKLRLFEHKTKGRIDEGMLVDKMAFDLQVMMYLYCMEHIYGEVPEGVIYNVLKRPELKQRTERNPETLREFLDRIEGDIRTRPDFYFVRFNADILPVERKEWLREFHQIMLRIREWNDNRSFYRVSSRCDTGGLKCECIPICSRDDRTNFSKRESVFPELEEIGAEE